jgi:hypothetical protein
MPRYVRRRHGVGAGDPGRVAINDANEASAPVEHASAVGREVAALYDGVAGQYLAAIAVAA